MPKSKRHLKRRLKIRGTKKDKNMWIRTKNVPSMPNSIKRALGIPLYKYVLNPSLTPETIEPPTPPAVSATVNEGLNKIINEEEE